MWRESRVKWLCCAMIVWLCVFGLSAASAQPQVTLAWDATTKNADGSLLTDLAGYRMYMAFAPITSKADAKMIAEVPADQTNTTVDVGALPEPGAVVYFRATAYDTSGNESDFSNEVSKDFLPPHTLTIRFQ